MIIEVAYGLPGAGKSTYLLKRFDQVLVKGMYDEYVHVEFDSPDRRNQLIPFINGLKTSNKYVVIDALIDIDKFMAVLNILGIEKLSVIINRFSPNVEQSIKNDLSRGRELNAVPTIRTMKIKELDEIELVKKYSNIHQVLVVEIPTYEDKS